MEGQSLFRNMNQMVAYQKGLTTWAKWVDLNLDPRKTRVIFRSMSPRHNRYNNTLCNAILSSRTSRSVYVQYMYLFIWQRKWLEML